MPKRTLIRRLGPSSDDTRGTVTVEFVLAIPFIFWTFMACICLFRRLPAKRDQSEGRLYDQRPDFARDQRDQRRLHRQHGEPVRPDDTHALGQRHADHRRSAGTRRTPLLRRLVGQSGFSDRADQRNIVRSGRPPAEPCPTTERVILVETNNQFEPLFKIGLNDLVLENFVFTRPRFVDQIKWLDA